MLRRLIVLSRRPMEQWRISRRWVSPLPQLSTRQLRAVIRHGYLSLMSKMQFASGWRHVMVSSCMNKINRNGLLYTVSQKKTSHLWLAIIFTYTVRLQQFLTKMLRRKYAIKTYFIFPPHLTNASALPEEIGNPEIVSFHLNAACFFTKKHKT